MRTTHVIPLVSRPSGGSNASIGTMIRSHMIMRNDSTSQHTCVREKGSNMRRLPTLDQAETEASWTLDTEH